MFAFCLGRIVLVAVVTGVLGVSGRVASFTSQFALFPMIEGEGVLTQAGRELMIAMSSDLPFVISNGHFVDRMKDEFFGALRNFWRLADAYERADVDLDWLRSLEISNVIFPNLDPSWFA